jgi:hypothetical protein
MEDLAALGGLRPSSVAAEYHDGPPSLFTAKFVTTVRLKGRVALR